MNVVVLFLLFEDLDGRGSVEQDRHAAVVNRPCIDISHLTGDRFLFSHFVNAAVHAGHGPNFARVGLDALAVAGVHHLVVATRGDVVSDFISKEFDTEFLSNQLSVGRVSSQDHFATTLGDKTVDSGGFRSVERLLRCGDDEKGAMGVLPVVDQHGGGHRVGNVVIAQRFPHQRELLFLEFIAVFVR